MADNTTGLHVKSLSTETVRAKLVDTGGSNEAAISAAGRLSVDGSGVTQPISGTVDTELPSAAALADATANPTTPLVGAANEVYNGSTWDRARTVTNGQDTTGTGIPAAGILGQLDDASTGTVTENQFAPVRISSRRALLVEGVASGTNLNVNLAASAATVTVDSELPAAAALADATSNPTVPGVGGFLMGYNGTTWDRVRTANTGRLQVDVITGGGSNASVLVDNAGFTDGTSSVTATGFIFDEVAGTALTENDVAAARIDSKRAQIGVIEDATTRGQRLAVSAAGAAHANIAQIGATTVVTGGTAGSLGVGGTVAHDAVGTGVNPALIGGYASAAAPTDVSADGDATRIWTLRNGSQVVNLASGGTLITVGQTTMSASIPVTIASNQSALTVDSELPAAAALADATSNPTVPGVGGFLMGYNGTTWDRVRTANTGRLQVDVITGGGSSTLVDNAAFTDGTTPVTPVGFVFDDVAGTALTENDIAAARIDSKRALVIVGEDASTRTQKWAISAAGALAGNITQIGGNTLVTGGVNGTFAVGGVLAHDAAAAAALPVGIGFFASAAAPSDVSADGDAVKAWALRNGSQVVNLASGGTLITVGQKTMANAFSVSIASDQSNLPTNITQIGGATPSATVYMPSRLTDGTAYYSKTGQAAGTASYVQLSDQTNTASVIATINSLKVDASSIAGAVPSATNALPVRLTDGSAFYAAASGAPTSPIFSTVTSSALGAGSSVDLDHTAITGGQTGYLMGADVSSAVPLKVEIKTVNSGTPTTRVVLFTQNGDYLSWRAPYKSFITQAGGATSRFRVTVTNRDNSQASDVYSTAFWDQF